MSTLDTSSLMERAFELGRDALAAGEVPVGCVLYLPGEKKHLIGLRIVYQQDLVIFRRERHHWGRPQQSQREEECDQARRTGGYRRSSEMVQQRIRDRLQASV